jgi:rod shape-determining protein MreC
MESVLGRYRNLTILVGVLFLQALGLAVQVKRSADAENTRLIRVLAVGAVTPFERGLVWAQSGSRNLWHNYFFLRGVRAENRQLKEEIEQMRLEQVRLSEDAAQARRLQTLLGFKEQYIAKTVPAQVIGSSGSDLSRSVYIDKGSNDGVAPDMAVITANGIVGKVLRVYASTSLVLMINDQTSGVGAMLEKSRLQGVLRGTPNGEVILERIMSDEQVAPGETVLSSGGDQIFPKGLPVGTVSRVNQGQELFLNIQVKPAADLNRLEEVLVVTEKQERETVVEGPGRVRAADILAQRLPSVPDKPAEDSAAAGSSASVGAGKISNGIAKPATQARDTASSGTASSGVGSSAVASVPVAGSAGTMTQAPKKVVQNAVSVGSGAGGSGGVGSATNSSPERKTASEAGSGPANSAAKAGAPKPKPAATQPAAQPSAVQPSTAQDNPH